MLRSDKAYLQHPHRARETINHRHRLIKLLQPESTGCFSGLLQYNPTSSVPEHAGLSICKSSGLGEASSNSTRVEVPVSLRATHISKNSLDGLMDKDILMVAKGAHAQSNVVLVTVETNDFLPRSPPSPLALDTAGCLFFGNETKLHDPGQ